MDLRITTERAGDATRVCVSGSLAGSSVAELDRVVREIQGRIRIDLGELRGADEGGLALLRVLRARGVHLERASPFMRLVLKAKGT